MPPLVPVNRGEIWWCDFRPSRGHEQDKRRPALVVSVDRLNHGKSGLVVVCPMSSVNAKIPLHVTIPEGVTGKPAMTILCEQVRTVSMERLDNRPLGCIDGNTMAEVEKRLRLILGL